MSGMAVGGVFFAGMWGQAEGGWGTAASATGITIVVIAMLAAWSSLRFIPNNRVGVIEKLWSPRGSVGEGRIIALDGEAGFQTALLRGGIHLGFWRWQFRIHKTSLVTIPQGKIGYVYARDGEPLPPAQTLGRLVECNHFQDATAFLQGHDVESLPGQRGRQLAILREGVYAINPALFVVMTEDAIYALPALLSRQEALTIKNWHQELADRGGFEPVVVGKKMETVDPLHSELALEVDSIGIVTVHDGPSLPVGEIIAPPVGGEAIVGLAGASVGSAAELSSNCHDNFQNPQAFLRVGGRRGRQYPPLTDGTYFINRWFATVELMPKTVVPIGHVGVVVSYFGRAGEDVSGTAFRHGERVAEGERGVWQRPLGPGKYAFNSYAGNIVMVPTTNFVLHWITGKSESHRYDESLRSIELVTRDAYEPRLPLSVVVHIDYQRAPNVIQRFGDVKKLITQTLDPLLSAYFRDIAHKKTMLELLHDRDRIQAEARAELRRKFHDFDIECVDVLIGKPDTDAKDDKIETLLEQLRTRQLSFEQLETYERQKAASEKLRELHEAQALAEMQTQLTNTRVKAQIAESEGAAELARAKKQAEKQVVMADAELAQSRRRAEQTVVLAEAESRREVLSGQGTAQRVMQVGLSEAAVLMRKISSYGDPRLYALEQTAAQLAHSSQPLVPERVFVSGANGADGETAGMGAGVAHGMAGLLLQLMISERTAFQNATPPDAEALREYTERMMRDTIGLLKPISADPK